MPTPGMSPGLSGARYHIPYWERVTRMSDGADQTPGQTPHGPQEPERPEAGISASGVRRLMLHGPDGAEHAYMMTDEAAARIGKSVRRIQASCDLYWRRIVAEEAAARTGDGPTPDYTPRPHELACIKLAYGPHTAQTLVRVDTIGLHFVNAPRQDGRRQLGNLPGWRNPAVTGKPPKPYHYKPRDQDRRFKATRERLAREAERAAAERAGVEWTPPTPEAEETAEGRRTTRRPTRRPKGGAAE